MCVVSLAGFGYQYSDTPGQVAQPCRARMHAAWGVASEESRQWKEPAAPETQGRVSEFASTASVGPDHAVCTTPCRQPLGSFTVQCLEAQPTAGLEPAATVLDARLALVELRW